MIATDTVRAALSRTPALYLQSTIAQRCGDGASGSRYHMSAACIRRALEQIEWREREHPEVKAPCRAFVATTLRGLVGVVELALLPPSTLIQWQDFKGTGRVSAVVEQSEIGALGVESETWLIVGPSEAGEIVYTFHPGEPVAPSMVEARDIVGMFDIASNAVIRKLTHAKIGTFTRPEVGESLRWYLRGHERAKSGAWRAAARCMHRAYKALGYRSHNGGYKASRLLGIDPSEHAYRIMLSAYGPALEAAEVAAFLP